MDISQKIQSLRDELNLHNYNYYVLDNAVISDYDFDVKLKELQELETKHPEFFDESSPTQKVGGTITKNFNTVVHQNRMYSLDNSYSTEDILDWENRIKKLLGDIPLEYTCELKYDGASISIIYENGKLKRAVTRGDGFQGDEVSNNVKTIKSVPLQLKGDYPESLEIRGEIVLPLAGFEKMNQELIEIGETPYSNPRNTASGSLKLQDSAEVSKRPLDCLLYTFIGSDVKYETHFESLQKARDFGFKVPNEAKLVKDTQGIFDFIEYWNIHRHDLPYETDGVVVKVNNLHYQDELGFTAKAPRWAVAYKFKAEQVSTILESISYQVGRTGAITPVANLQAVQLAGTIVKRASLHNADQIEKLDIRVNDTVFVEKGGEIIPKIIAVDLTQRPENSEPTKYITHCPECQTLLVRSEGEANHYCPNFYGCPPQIIGRIKHFVSKKAMNIDSLGGGTIDLLYSNSKIINYADLYFLNYEDIFGLEKWLDNDDAGLKNNNQLQVLMTKAIFGLSKKWGNFNLIESQSIAKKIDKLNDVFSLNASEVDVDFKKLNTFRERLSKAMKNISEINYFSFPHYVSLDLLLDIKFHNYFATDIFLRSSLVEMQYIDNLMNIDVLKENKDFEAFVVSIADRKRIGIKEQSATKIISSIENSKKIPFEKVLFSIGINDVGEVGAKNLAVHFKNIDNLINATFDELTAIRDIGQSTAKNIIKFFENGKNIDIVNRLKKGGLNFQVDEKELSSQKLENLTFVISGTFNIDRDKLKSIIEDNGGKNVGSLSKSTSYLIVGENMGPAKKDKAEKEKIKMISEQEFLKLLE